MADKLEVDAAEAGLTNNCKGSKTFSSSCSDNRHRIGLTDLHVEEAAPQHEFSKPWTNFDVVLVVEGQNLHVHRVILEMASPVFKTMFSRECAHENEICLTDKKVNEFVDFLRQMYPQFPSTLTLDNVDYIYALAKEFQIKSVLSVCKMFMSSQQITRNNASKLLVMAQKYKLDDVRQKCCQELQKLTLQDLERSVSFENMDAQSLRDVVVPRAKRLENCMQQLVPQLLGFVDCAVYLASIRPDDKYMTVSKPKLCSLHYDVINSKKANYCGSSDERFKCKVCLSMLAAKNWHTQITPAQYVRGKVKSSVESERFYTSGYLHFDEKVHQIFPEISKLVKSQV